MWPQDTSNPSEKEARARAEKDELRVAREKARLAKKQKAKERYDRRNARIHGKKA